MPRNDTWRGRDAHQAVCKVQLDLTETVRNDTWRGRDAHQGLAEGLGPWRVGWSGPGRIGGGGSCRRGGPGRRPPGARGVRAGFRFSRGQGRRPRAMNAMTTLSVPLGTTIDVSDN